MGSVEGERVRGGREWGGGGAGEGGYRRGGPRTVTDCNVLLGKLRPEFFPRLFGPDGDQAIDVDAVRARFAELTAATGLSAEALAEGFLAIAVDAMARAIKRESVERGHDVADCTQIGRAHV